MSRLTLILLPPLLVLAPPAMAEARPARDKTSQVRPLNLSLPRDAMQAPGSPRIDETVDRNLREAPPAQRPKSPGEPALLPYGAGYEFRHPGMAGAGAGIPPGAGFGTGSSAGPGAGGSPGPGGSPGAGRRGR